CVMAMVTFVAASQNWLITRNRWWETVALLLICFTLFRPGYWLDRIRAPFVDRPPAELTAIAESMPRGATVRIRVESQTRTGDDVDKLIRLTMRSGKTGRERLANAGVTLAQQGDGVMLQQIRFGSEAAKFHLPAGDKVTAVLVPADRPDPFWFAIPAFALFALIFYLQSRRKRAPGHRPKHAIA